jgi:hypothetical protein
VQVVGVHAALDGLLRKNGKQAKKRWICKATYITFCTFVGNRNRYEFDISWCCA